MSRSRAIALLMVAIAAVALAAAGPARSAPIAVKSLGAADAAGVADPSPVTAIGPKHSHAVAWIQHNSLKVRTINADGSFGKLHDFGSAASDPAIAGSPKCFVVAWVRHDSKDKRDHVVVRRIDADGTTGGVHKLTPGSEDGRDLDATDPHVTIGHSCKATVVWHAAFAPLINGGAHDDIQARTISKTGKVGAMSKVAGPFAQEENLRDFLVYNAAPTAGGGIVVVWTYAPRGKGQFGERQLTPQGLWRPKRVLEKYSTTKAPGRAEIAVDAAGYATIVWDEFTFDNVKEVPFEQLRARRLHADGTLEGRVTLTKWLRRVLSWNVTTDAAGNATALWLQQNLDPKNVFTGFRTDAAVEVRRYAASGTLGTITRLGTSCGDLDDNDNATLVEVPSIAAGPNDQAAAAWVNCAKKIARVQERIVKHDGSLGSRHTRSQAKGDASRPVISWGEHAKPAILWQRHRAIDVVQGHV